MHRKDRRSPVKRSMSVSQTTRDAGNWMDQMLLGSLINRTGALWEGLTTNFREYSRMGSFAAGDPSMIPARAVGA